MIKKNWPFILLVIINIILIFYIVLSKRHLEMNVGKVDNITLVQNNLLLHYGLEDERINPSIKLISPELDTIDLVHLVANKPKLCFIYPKISCKPCVDNVITLLNKLCEDLNRENIVLITDYVNLRDLILFAKINKIKFKIYSLSSLSYKENLIKSVPYLTVLDNDLILKSFYIPINGEAELLNKYLEIVVKRIAMFN